MSDATSEIAVRCANPDCKIAENKKCVEGLALDKCPHYGKPPQPRPSSPSPAGEQHGTPLPSGELLSVTDADGVLRRGNSRVIAIVGPKESGKTTLIASIYELFLRGKIGPYRFSQSKTLYAFERSCHPSRAISQNVIPKTERTLLTEVHFYHLATRKDGEPAIDMLLADRNGEDFGSSMDDSSTASEFVEIARADTITFLVDGAQLLDLSTRTLAASEILLIAQSLVDGEAILGNSRAAIVLTKVDCIRNSTETERVNRDFANLVQKFVTRFDKIFRQIQPFEVAACPHDISLPLGYGVAELLGYWQEGLPEAIPAVTPYHSKSTRYMHLLVGIEE